MTLGEEENTFDPMQQSIQQPIQQQQQQQEQDSTIKIGSGTSLRW